MIQFRMVRYNRWYIWRPMYLSDRFARFRRIFFSVFLNQILVFGVTFVSSILVVRALDIKSYATYILFNTTLNLASNLCNLGLRSYMTVFVPGATPEKGRRILWAVMAGQWAASLLVIAALVPFVTHPAWRWMEKFRLERLPMLFAFFSVMLLVGFAPRQFAGFFRYLDEDHRRANRVQLIAGVAVPLFLIASWAILGHLNLTYVLMGMALVQIASIAFIMFMSRDMAGFPGIGPIYEETVEALRYSWPFALLPVATQFIELGNRYFLAGYGSAVDLAQFSFNYGICSAAFMLVNTSMGFTFFPEALRIFKQGRRRDAERLNLKGVLACAALVGVGFVAFWAVSPVFFRVMGRESLRLPALPFALICGSFLAQVLAQHGGFLLQAYNLRISNVGITLTGTALSMGLNSLLIPRYHVTGAAAALCVTAFVLLGLNLLPVWLRKRDD